MSNIWTFENVNLYKILCPPKLKGYEQDHFKHYKKGDFVYFQKDPSRTIYLVNKGKVRIVDYTDKGEERVKAVLTRGEIFGEMAILGEEQRSDFAVAASEGTALCPLRIESMYDLMRTNHRFSLAIHKLIGLRIKRLERRFERLFYKDVKTRLIEFLLELTEDKGKQLADSSIEVQHFYTQKDIADLIGARRETVVLLMNDLKKDGLINYKRNKMNVLDLEGLEGIIGIKQKTAMQM